MYEYPNLLVTRPVEPHLGRCPADAAVHLGDWDTATGLPFDLVEEAQWDSRREGEHAARIAGRGSPNCPSFVPGAQPESK
jgi:hypothetical protein